MESIVWIIFFLEWGGKLVGLIDSILMHFEVLKGACTRAIVDENVGFKKTEFLWWWAKVKEF